MGRGSAAARANLHRPYGPAQVITAGSLVAPISKFEVCICAYARLQSTRSVADERHRLIHDYMNQLAMVGRGVTLSVERKEAPFRAGKTNEFTKQSLKERGNRITDLSYRLQRFTKNDPLWK
jgi:hypothetical protein